MKNLLVDGVAHAMAWYSSVAGVSACGEHQAPYGRVEACAATEQDVSCMACLACPMESLGDGGEEECDGSGDGDGEGEGSGVALGSGDGDGEGDGTDIEEDVGDGSGCANGMGIANVNGDGLAEEYFGYGDCGSNILDYAAHSEGVNMAIAAGAKCLVRSETAGVNVGILVNRNGREVTLQPSHKIYRWRGAYTLHDLAKDGASMTAYTRISQAAPGQVVVLNVVEILECSDEAYANLTTPRWLDS